MRTGVYPRVCGGTNIRRYYAAHAEGLSPRMRGNLRQFVPFGHNARSIPAYAGEPHIGDGVARCRWVYPRVCGGTPSSPAAFSARRGLSPRMRGNPTFMAAGRKPEWSIPAYAGEPPPGLGKPAAVCLYPRVCGGTAVRRYRDAYQRGLSPRMRGNPTPSAKEYNGRRSIPAYAGEPAVGG